MVVRTRRCYVCEEEVELVTDMKEHMVIHRGQFRLSNDLSEVVKTTCKVCAKTLSVQRMRSHTKTEHGMTITEYKAKFNQNFFSLVEKVFHGCGICGEELLLDQDIISGHLISNKMTHKVSHKDYNETFLMRAKHSKAVVKKENIPAQTKTLVKNENITQDKTVVKNDSFTITVRKPSEINLEVVEANPEAGEVSVASFLEFLGGVGGLAGEFPALAALIAMDLRTEEATVRGAQQFAASVRAGM